MGIDLLWWDLLANDSCYAKLTKFVDDFRLQVCAAEPEFSCVSPWNLRNYADPQQSCPPNPEPPSNSPDSVSWANTNPIKTLRHIPIRVRLPFHNPRRLVHGCKCKRHTHRNDYCDHNY